MGKKPAGKNRFPTFLLLLIIAPTILLVSNVYSGDGRKIDLYTQKQPFNGKGPNQPSDSFQPQEEVFLYALVTYNEAPIQNKLVAFQVDGPRPSDGTDPIRIILSSTTNESGIASVSFRIPTPIKGGEALVIGEWFAIATVDIAEVIVNDTLTFRVDYGVKILNVATLNSNLNTQTMFLRKESAIFKIMAENTGLTSKKVFFTVNVIDASATSIIHAEFEQILNPGQNNLQTAPCQIPENSKIGEAVVHVNALTAPANEGGTLYGPEATTTFKIVTRDIALTSIMFSSNIVRAGETVKITASVKNKGNYTESFYVSIFSNQTFLMKKYVDTLPPSKTAMVEFAWNTTGVQKGTYIITGVAGPVEGEIEVEDNVLTNGSITVLPPPPQAVHDVAITCLNATPLQVQAGQPVNITLCVRNLGTEPESFNVTLYYGGFPLTILRVDFLIPSGDVILSYVWNTSNVLEGNYTIKAVIPQLKGEENIANNELIDGVVWVRAPSPPIKKHDVAVTSLNISKSQVYSGESVNVNIYVVNVGDYNESFRLIVYANMSEVWSCLVEDLRPGHGKLLGFTWRVSLNVGRYVIWAKAEYVEGEVNVENNIFIDGILLVSSPPAYYHDVAVIYVHPSSNIVYIGQRLNVTVIVKNFGNATESFNLTLYYDLNVIGRVLVQQLPPFAEKAVIFEWDTSVVSEGNYTLKAYAEPVEGEINVENNLYMDGEVTLKSPAGVTRDVAVLWLGPDKTEVKVGEKLKVTVTVANLGSVPETFNLTIWYDSEKISEISITNLPPLQTKDLTVDWNTSNIKPGTYTLRASIPHIIGEANIDNNEFADGTVTVKEEIAYPSIILILQLLTILILICIIAIILSYYARKRKEAYKPKVVILRRLHV